jgi:gamma-glutamyltranspeptidase / glutathione hydrolase
VDTRSALTRPLLRGSRGAVAAGHPLAVGSGLALLRRGGSAADAAIGAAAVLGVVLPQACGLGGDALLLVRAADDTRMAFNGTGAAPAQLALPVPTHGAGSATVPGCVDGWARVHERHGRLGMDEVLADAVALARDGFAVGDPLAAALRSVAPELARDAARWPLLGARAGQLVPQPALAELLTAIGRDGPAAFYEGRFAERLVADQRARGGRFCEADLAAHATEVRDPLSGGFRDVRVTVQPPASQAVLALAALRRLGAAPPVADAGERALAGARAFAFAFARKHELAQQGEVERLLEAAAGAESPAAGGDVPRGGTHTAAVAVADDSGLVVSQLVSIFEPFGSRVLIGSGGYLLNNRLSDTSADPASANAPAGGRRPLHTLSPAIVEHDDRVFALATPGADGQVQVIAQIVQGLAEEGLSLPQAVERPRWRLADGAVALEAGLPPAARDHVERNGFAVRELPYGHALFGAAVVAGLDRREGCVFAASDARREAWAGAW